MLSRKQILFASLQKSYKIFVLSFFIWVAEVPQKIIYYILVCFSQILPCFTFSQFCKSCACFFFAITSWQSWETVAVVGNLCFQQRLSRINLLLALTTLISLWWVSYEGSFQVCEGRWWKKIQECQELKLGDSPGTPKKYLRRLKRLS